MRTGRERAARAAALGAVVGLVYQAARSSSDPLAQSGEQWAGLIGQGIGAAIGGAVLFWIAARLWTWSRGA